MKRDHQDGCRGQKIFGDRSNGVGVERSGAFMCHRNEGHRWMRRRKEKGEYRRK